MSVDVDIMCASLYEPVFLRLKILSRKVIFDEMESGISVKVREFQTHS